MSSYVRAHLFRPLQTAMLMEFARGFFKCITQKLSQIHTQLFDPLDHSCTTFSSQGLQSTIFRVEEKIMIRTFESQVSKTENKIYLTSLFVVCNLILLSSKEYIRAVSDCNKLQNCSMSLNSFKNLRHSQEVSYTF